MVAGAQIKSETGFAQIELDKKKSLLKELEELDA